LATPMLVSSGMSASGMMPPPKTTMSEAPRAFSRSTTLRKRVMCAPDRTERPTASASFLDGGLDDLLGRLVEAGVDDLHAGVAQGAGDHLRAAVVAVETCFATTTRIRVLMSVTVALSARRIP